MTGNDPSKFETGEEMKKQFREEEERGAKRYYRRGETLTGRDLAERLALANTDCV